MNDHHENCPVIIDFKKRKQEMERLKTNVMNKKEEFVLNVKKKAE